MRARKDASWSFLLERTGEVGRGRGRQIAVRASRIRIREEETAALTSAKGPKQKRGGHVEERARETSDSVEEKEDSDGGWKASVRVSTDALSPWTLLPRLTSLVGLEVSLTPSSENPMNIRGDEVSLETLQKDS